MKRDLKNTLLLLSFLMHLILKAKSGTSVLGITGDNATAEFTFQNLGVDNQPNKPSLYKNDYKIESCKQPNKYCSVRFVLSEVENSTAILHIINIKLEDEGIYHVTVPVEGETPLIFSNKICLIVKQRNKTTETVQRFNITVTENPKSETSAKTILICINASVLLCICFIIGLLVWFHRTCPRKSTIDNPTAQSNSTTQQVYCGRAGTVSINCVEYGELDFRNRPARNDREKPAEVHQRPKTAWNMPPSFSLSINRRVGR